MLFRCLLLAGLFILQQSAAQVDHPVVRKLHDYTSNRPQEKVFLHFDKPYYVPGETIWFKAYVTLGGDHLPSPQSGLLYVDLYDEQDELIDQLRIRCQNGFGEGQFDLADTIPSKKLRVRAYTNWMKNFSTDFFFQKAIPLVTAKLELPLTKSEISVGIYPEGGQLIAAVTNRLAVKTDVAMAGRTLKLLYAGKEVVNEVEIDERGYGLFTLKPAAGKNYSLSYQNQNFSLPTASDKGISLTLNSYSYSDFARLTLRKKTDNATKKVTILVHTRGTVHHIAELDFSRSVAIANIPKTILPRGVNHLTIFDASGKPLAERLFYVDRNDPVKLSVSNSQEALGIRDKVTLKLDLSDLSGSALQANLSLSATHRGEIKRRPQEENIKTYLLLNSDLRGTIIDPGYYFSDDSKEKKIALDKVMMTHGWRRFAWEKLLSQDMDSIQNQPERGMTLKGKLVGKSNGKPVSNGTVTYFNNQSGQTVMRTQQTNEQGEFILNNLLHANLNRVSLKGIISDKGLKRARKQFVAFELDTTSQIASSPWLIPADPIQLFSLKVTEEIIANTGKRELYDSIYNFDPDVRIVEGVTVESQQELDFDRNKISSAYGKGTTTFEVGDEPRAVSSRDILSLMAGKIAGVRITPSLRPEDTNIQIRDATRIFGDDKSGSSSPISPKFMLNDMETDLATIVYLPVISIDRVEVYKGPDAAIFGLETIGGVIAVYTKKGFQQNYETKTEEGLYSISIPGIHAPREFFSPDYAKDRPEHAKPDIRSLIHWQPTVVTDSTGKAKVEFWTTDNTGTIDIEIQGLTYSGKPIVKKTSVEVRNKL